MKLNPKAIVRELYLRTRIGPLKNFQQQRNDQWCFETLDTK
jgi:hypothetical protein